MTYRCETMGAGPDVVLVHGWAWHGGVWESVARQLAARFRVWMPELPGHGHNRQTTVNDGLDAWSDAMRQQVPAAATWVGWSLGGLVALAAARLRYATRLVLIGTTPRFVSADDWDCGWPAEQFARFRGDIERDGDIALERFAGLHVPAGATPRPLLRRLRGEIFARGVPATQALRAGLDILRDTDMRAVLTEVTVPTLVLHGEGDQIVFPRAAAYLAQALPDAHHRPVAAAGHALPLSHEELVAVTIGEFAGG